MNKKKEKENDLLMDFLKLIINQSFFEHFTLFPPDFGLIFISLFTGKKKKILNHVSNLVLKEFFFQIHSGDKFWNTAVSNINELSLWFVYTDTKAKATSYPDGFTENPI